VAPLDGTFGLHPSLKALKPHWDAKRFAAIVNVGSPHSTRSHFDAQDFMEYAAPGSRTVREGWLNRYLRATRKKEAPALRAVAMQPLLPRALRGTHPALAVPDKSVLQNDKVLGMYEDFYREGDDPVVSTGRETLETLRAYREIVEKNRKERRTAYPNGRLASKLQDIAGLLHAGAGLEVACVDLGGWDHHANEETALANLLREVGDSLGAFAEDLGSHLGSTLVLVMSEFGRTCRENGNRGTDHGHGGVMLLLGGAVRGGRILGKWDGLADRNLYEGRDLPVTTDFRDVFAEVLRGHMAFEAARDFFPEYKPKAFPGLF